MYALTKKATDRYGGCKIQQIVVKSSTEAKAAQIHEQALCPCCGNPKFGNVPDQTTPFTQVKNFSIDDLNEWLYWQMRGGWFVEIVPDWYWDEV